MKEGMELMNDHAYYMQRALSLAARGQFSAHPNPMVGCVIVNNNILVGEGWHHAPGTPHAERHALAQAGSAAAGADVYVNLEPCAHTGRTGPCADALIAARVKRVFIPFADPNPRVNGQGIAKLKAHGIDVISGIETADAQFLNRVFLYAQSTQQAYVIAKWAMTLDGQLTVADPNQRWISSADAREHAHQQRACIDAIVVGAETFRLDKPQLTARPLNIDITPLKQPKRLILSGHRSLTREDFAHVHDELWLVTPHAHEALQPLAHIHQLILPDPADPQRINLSALLRWLVEAECHSLMVEGGNHTLASFFKAGYVNECHLYQSLIHSGFSQTTSLSFLHEQPAWHIQHVQHWEHDLFIQGTRDV